MKLKIFISIATWLFIVMFFTSHCLAISIPEEKELAGKFMKMVKQNQTLLSDPIVQEFVSQIGNQILSYLPPQPFQYSFYVVNEDIFNAFAAPGANIFVYRGLITSLDTTDELAGIIGHEIAHAVSRHVSESIDRSKYIGLSSLAGVLAGAIIGGSAGADTGKAIITGSLALGQTTMLAFTRENETEADEKGIMFLKQTCFSPRGLLSGLKKIREADYRGVEGIPDYVKTHPGTGKRIAHTETILSNYNENPDKPPCPVSYEFDMVKYRLLGLYADIDPTFRLLGTQLGKDPDNAAIHYGLGLLYIRKQRKDQAIEHLKKALDLKMFDSMILVDLGRAYLLNGRPDKAFNVLNGLTSDSVIGVMARLYQADVYLEKHEISKAERGYTAVINKAPRVYPMAYYNLAKIKSMNQEKGLSHYYLGIYYSLKKNPKNAIRHLNKSLEDLSDKEKINDAKKRLKNLEKKPGDPL